MKHVEASGKTVDDAILAALEEIALPREEVDIEIIEEGTKGLFGLFGGKQAKVKVTEKDSPKKRAERFLHKVLESMNVKADILIQEEENNLKVRFEGNSMGILIGHRGETLDSLQYLTSLVVNKGKEKYKRVILDTENYRNKREETLIRLAKKLAAQAKRTGKNIVLEPMNPYERRVLHATLQSNPYVSTHSEGEEPNRKVVITVK